MNLISDKDTRLDLRWELAILPSNSEARFMNSAEFKDIDYSIFELLDRIKKRPAIFLDGDPSLKRLRSFLVGYECALGRLQLTLAGHAIFYLFNDWVAAHLDFGNSTSGWCNMILAKCGNDDAKAYQFFFDLLDQFCKEKGLTK